MRSRLQTFITKQETGFLAFSAQICGEFREETRFLISQEKRDRPSKLLPTLIDKLLKYFITAANHLNIDISLQAKINQ